MKTATIVVGAFLALVSAAAPTQDDKSMPTQQQTQPGRDELSPASRTGDLSKGGMQSGSSESGTLMQRREQGMSPDSSQNSGQNPQSTGKMKQ
ncbi:hypothetical protein [Paraburkholderia terrae]